jgi:hypothetical protein
VKTAAFIAPAEKVDFLAMVGGRLAGVKDGESTFILPFGALIISSCQP